MEGEGQVVVFLGTEVVVRKGRKAGAEGMAQVGRAEEVVAHPPEKLEEGKPKWQNCKTQRERGPEEVKCPSQTKQEGAKDISTSERTRSSEKPSEMGSVSVRSIAMGCGG